MMGTRLLCFAVLMLVGYIKAQSCPSDNGWILYDKKCYKFNAYPRLAHQPATRSCQENGATLASINTQPEHQFIANWLLQNDQARDDWLTSGVNLNLGVRWDGDGTLTTSFSRWVNNTQQGAPEGQRVLYVYTGTEYGWDLGSKDIQYSFICEISVNEIYRILQVFRDFDYGLDVDNPSQAPRGPTFMQEPEDTVVLGTTKTTVYLDCLAKGNPEPSYQWLIKQQGKMELLKAGPKYSFTTGRLEIRDASPTDENTYQCTATNNQGTILSSSSQLSFGFLGEFSNVNPASVTGNEYDGAQLECPNINARPGVSYQWYKDNFMIIRPNMQKHYFVSATGKLFFSELAPSDQGTYFCLVTLTSDGQKGNYVGATQTESRNSLGFGLLVKSGGASQFQPKIQNDFIYVSPQTPTKGGTVRLECFAYGTGPLDYSWTRGGNKPLPNGHVFDSNYRILILSNVELEDGGIYTCTVYSKVTNIADQRSMDLVIQAKSYFTIPLAPQHVDIGSSLTWHCEAAGQPPPTYQWYKNGNVLANSAGITITANSLTIESVDPKRDNGMYQCAATNRYGTTFSSAQLRVLELKPAFLKTPMTKTAAAALGGNVTIICNPTAAPKPTFTWTKDGQGLGLVAGQYGQDDHYKLLMNGNLIIQNVVSSDQGKYTCRAENVLGYAEDYSNLRIMDRTVISQKPSDQKVEVNMTAMLMCQASHSSEIDMTYMWIFNNHIINYEREVEYRLGKDTQNGFLYIIGSKYKNEGKYTCTATSSMDQQSVSAFLTVIGPPGEPGGVSVAVRPPMQIDVNEQGNLTNPDTTRWIIWTDGLDHGSIITHYFIEFRTNFDLKWRVHPDGNNLPKYSVTNNQFPDKRYARLTNLKAFAGIEFRVLARNSFGIGPPSIPTVITQISGAKPTVTVTNLRGGEGSVGDLVIAWDPLPKEDHNGPGLQYKVSYRTYEAATQSDSSKWRSEYIPHDAACMVKREYVSLRGQTFLCSKVILVGANNYFLRYVVKVQAVNVYGEGPSTNDTIVMSSEEMPLGAPSGVFADVYNSTALMVRWKQVPNDKENVRGKLKGYKINYWRMYAETEAQALQNIIELKPGQNNLESGLIIGLLPFSWYEFNVQCYNSAGNGPKSSDYNQQTLNKVPSQYPTEVQVYSVEGFGVRVNFRGISTQIREEPLQGYKVQYWKSNENILSARVADFGRSYTGVIRNLSSSQLYELRVYGYNRGGQGTRSSPTVYFTVGDGQIQINAETTQILSGESAKYPAAFVIVFAALITLIMTL